MSSQFVDNYLLFQLAIVSQKFSAEFHQVLKKHSFSTAKWRILVNLMDRPGLLVTQISKITLLEQSHVTKLVDQLCEEKLTRKQASSQDKRRVQVFITERGKTVIQPLMKIAKEHEEKVLSELKPGEPERLKSILNSLIQSHVESIKPHEKVD